MNGLADKAHSDTFNNHPYISSSGMPVGKFTATYVGIIVE